MSDTSKVPTNEDDNKEVLNELNLHSLPTQIELQKMIEELVSQMEIQFDDVSQQINKKMEDMDARITELEKGIGNLLNQASSEVDQ
ncbi:hypothetical protein BCR32DRAFT_294237 [Anaeromyces robustus]|uniref:Heat shock factor binding protein 1-domain-containing protein n=1 Tax=Anaeromyces robustus TaxID=1754192 RepID=A0A1Y1X1W0_9FUNG|nr:hypothetical protein BCR32DRAFT_294237 [Anaeromyces robustus]|eukprot:ORX79790.1 hypothetical protein BCR32DRAFT_294237 [Anaeromyces robustus]